MYRIAPGFISRVLNLCRKEFLAIIKDPASRIILIAPVIVQSFLYGYAATYDLANAPYALLDQSRSRASMDLIARLDGSDIFRRVATLQSPHDFAAIIDSQKALFIVHIGPRFEDALHQQSPAPVQIILDGRNSNTAGSALSAFNAVINAFNAQWRRQHDGGQTPFVVVQRAWFNPNIETRWHLLPGLIAALAMLQVLTLTALSVAREREQGTFDQLLVTPMSPIEIMIGKSIPPICVGLVQSSIILIVTLYWFNIPLRGSASTLYIALFLFTLANVGVGLSISALSNTMQQAMFYTFMLIMPMMLLSGLITPVRNMPEALQIITLINPLRFAIDMIQRIYLEGVNLYAVSYDVLPLLAIAAVTMPIATWLFRNKLS